MQMPQSPKRKSPVEGRGAPTSGKQGGWTTTAHDLTARGQQVCIASWLDEQAAVADNGELEAGGLSTGIAY